MAVQGVVHSMHGKDGPEVELDWRTRRLKSPVKASRSEAVPALKIQSKTVVAAVPFNVVG